MKIKIDVRRGDSINFFNGFAVYKSDKTFYKTTGKPIKIVPLLYPEARYAEYYFDDSRVEILKRDKSGV